VCCKHGDSKLNFATLVLLNDLALSRKRCRGNIISGCLRGRLNWWEANKMFCGPGGLTSKHCIKCHACAQCKLTSEEVEKTFCFSPIFFCNRCLSSCHISLTSVNRFHNKPLPLRREMFPSLAARKTYVPETHFAARK